ncbi:MAG: hypothetical protein Q8O95_02975, partial [bacterium]|nr:hypothetical protein [bacterium]
TIVLDDTMMIISLAHLGDTYFLEAQRHYEMGELDTALEKLQVAHDSLDLIINSASLLLLPDEKTINILFEAHDRVEALQKTWEAERAARLPRNF